MNNGISYPPLSVIYLHPDAIWSGEKYLVCRRNGSQEIVSQSDRSLERVEHSIDVLNEHERLNTREEVYYWRLRVEGEVSNGRRAYL